MGSGSSTPISGSAHGTYTNIWIHTCFLNLFEYDITFHNHRTQACAVLLEKKKREEH